MLLLPIKAIVYERNPRSDQSLMRSLVCAWHGYFRRELVRYSSGGPTFLKGWHILKTSGRQNWLLLSPFLSKFPPVWTGLASADKNSARTFQLFEPMARAMEQGCCSVTAGTTWRVAGKFNLLMTIQSSKKEPHQNIVRTYLPLGQIRIPYDDAGTKALWSFWLFGGGISSALPCGSRVLFGWCCPGRAI